MRSSSQRCPVAATLAVIGGKWKALILYQLRGRTLRFSQLRKALPGITQKMLSQQLKDMEGDGLLVRRAYAEVPPRVEYSLTPMGETLGPILDAMCAWGERYGVRIRTREIDVVLPESNG